jgi:hypothetical protein
MAVVKVKGSLYFLRDKDYLTGEMGRYVKIGIVRKDKTTEKRIQEHQTGNPRDIIDLHTIQNIPFVEKLETLIHYRYNEKWIAGEWFDLNDVELIEVIAEAERLKAEQIKYEPFFLNAEKLKIVESNGNTRAATPEEEDLRDAYIAKLSRKNEVYAILKLIRDKICNSLGTIYGRIDGVIDVIFIEDSYKFDSSLFKSSYPEFYESYCKTETQVKIKDTFSVEGKKNAKLETINISLSDLKKNIPTQNFNPSQFGVALVRTKDIEDLHAQHLIFNKEYKHLEWDLEVIENQLKNALGIDEKIVGVCSWKRVLNTKSSSKLDEEKLKSERPELYSEFLSLKKGFPRVIISELRPYMPINIM